MTATPPDDTPQPPDAAPPGGPAPAPRGRALPVLAVVALVVAVAAAALALGQRGEVDDLRDERDDRREVARVAGDFAEAYMTFDFEDTDKTAEAIADLVTEDFAAAFERAREPLRASFAELQTSTTAEVQEVFVGDIEDGKARALVILDIDLTSTVVGDQGFEDFTILTDLEEIDGRWRVDSQTYGPQPDLTGGATSTTAPAAAPAP
jgi:Mce-associated membrane protein